MTTFDKAFERVFTNEGGFQKSPDDRGNWTSGVIGQGELKGTKFGISAMTYPDLDIKNLLLWQAKEIYKRDWWDKLHMEQFRPAMQFQMFDSAINHGMYNTVKMLQLAVGVKDDGQIGPATKTAVLSMDINDILLCFLAERLSFMSALRTWQFYGKGWARRISENLKYAAEDN